MSSESASRLACRKHDESDAFVAENYAELKARKVFAAGVPEELGGGGASVADLAGMLRTLAHHCSSTALALSMHTHLVATAAWRWRNQKAPVDGLLKRVVAEDLVLVSTGGADWLLGTGKATKADGGYRVTGRKSFCSGAPAGGLMMTTAVVDDPVDGPTVLQIAVPTSAAGVKIENDWKALGMRGTGSHDISFEDVFVPDAAVALRRPSGKWHPLIHVVAMVALPVFNAVYVGVAEAARDLALESAKRRRDDRLVQAHAGEMENELTSAQLALARMIDMATTLQAGCRDNGRDDVLPRHPWTRYARRCRQGDGPCRRRLVPSQEPARTPVPGCAGRSLPSAAGKAPDRARRSLRLRSAARMSRTSCPENSHASVTFGASPNTSDYAGRITR